jgi:hypothetical protein
MRTLAKPAEVEQLMALLDPLEHLDRDRKAAIARMFFEVVADCARCEDPVRRCDPRRVVGDRLHHLDCVSDAGARGSAPAGGLEGEEVADG